MTSRRARSHARMQQTARASRTTATTCTMGANTSPQGVRKRRLSNIRTQSDWKILPPLPPPRTHAWITTAAVTASAHAPTTPDPCHVAIAQLALPTTGRRAAKTSTSAWAITAAVTAAANASTRWDPCHVAIAQLGIPTTEGRAAKTSTSAWKTTAAVTEDTYASTPLDPWHVPIAQMGMRTTGRTVAKKLLDNGHTEHLTT